jgi:ABC-type antimicrobial peptide transport system permease subunit
VLASALNGLLPVLVVSPATLLTGVAFALGVGALSGLIPAFGAMHLRVVDALRRV